MSRGLNWKQSCERFVCNTCIPCIRSVFFNALHQFNYHSAILCAVKQFKPHVHYNHEKIVSCSEIEVFTKLVSEYEAEPFYLQFGAPLIDMCQLPFSKKVGLSLM
jgi:hypothetical protein